MTPLLAQRPRADSAFERLYQEHVHAIYRYALAVLHNEADAEDVTQNTFLNAYRAYTRGERPERPHNWLIKIAHNVCRQRFRDSSRRPQEVTFEENLAVSTAEADPEVPTAGELRRALGFLNFNQRAALVMRELEGRSYAEIAQVLDVSVGAVETLIFRSRRALREQLEGSLTCEEAELTLSRLHDDRLSNSERGHLRAHLRECKECAALERRRRAQRAALKHLGAVPLPASLTSFFGSGAVAGGTALTGTGLGVKIAAVLAAGAVAGGIGHEALKADAAKNNASTPAQATSVYAQGAEFAALSRLTGGRTTGNPLAAKSPAQAELDRQLVVHRAISKRVRELTHGTHAAATQPDSQVVNGTLRNTVRPLIPRVPRVRLPVRVPRVPPVQVAAAPVQLPPLPPLPPAPPPPILP